MSYYLVDLYEGNTEVNFGTKEELVQYLKEAKEEGNLGGEGRYSVFRGQELGTVPFWREAFGKSVFDRRRARR